MIERISDGKQQPDDVLESSLRPTQLKDFVGQTSFKSNMEVYIQAALERSEPLDHILISGPPGLGKTTFSLIISKEMIANIRVTSAPVIEKAGDMAALLSALKEQDILFIDEIHRLRPIVEETLYSAMEDYTLDINLGQGTTSKTVRINLPRFTLIGATTRAGALTQPLISRFGILGQFEFYTTKDIHLIAKRNASLLGIAIEEDALQEIAKRSRGTPRILNRILRRVRDFAQVQKVSTLTKSVAQDALDRMHIDPLGLDNMDRRILRALIQQFGGGPVGIENISVTLGEDASNIEDMYEPYLIQTGFIQRTPRGRIATKKAL